MSDSRQPAGSIDLSEADLKDAVEVIRAFVQQSEPIRGGIYIDPPYGMQPFGFGIFLADLLRHAAYAVSYKFGFDAEKVREAIESGLRAELDAPTQQIKPISH